MTNSASYLPAKLPKVSGTLPIWCRNFPGARVASPLGPSFEPSVGKAIAELIARNCWIAREMARQLAQEPGIMVENEVILNQVAIRFGADRSSIAGDKLTSRVIERVQADGICFAAGAQWKGHRIMRLSISSWATTENDADRSVAAIIDAWRVVQANGAGRTTPM